MGAPLLLRRVLREGQLLRGWDGKAGSAERGRRPLYRRGDDAGISRILRGPGRRMVQRERPERLPEMLRSAVHHRIGTAGNRGAGPVRLLLRDRAGNAGKARRVRPSRPGARRRGGGWGFLRRSVSREEGRRGDRKLHRPPRALRKGGLCADRGDRKLPDSAKKDRIGTRLNFG